MPTVSFLSFFIDFIRHGKHHQNRHLAPDNTRDLRQTPQNTVTHTPAAARIDERKEKEKSIMPTYEGLENFKLDIKMGECVIDHLSIISPFLTVTYFSSGAFSNVFKALEISTGKHVASMVSVLSLIFYFISHLIILVKVVRKFELNASQVSSDSFPNVSPFLFIPLIVRFFFPFSFFFGTRGLLFMIGRR